MRTIFFVMAAQGFEPSGAMYNMPLNQTLRDTIQLALAFLERGGARLGSADDYVVRDLYGQQLDQRMLIRQVPFPGCVIVVARTGVAKAGGQILEGDEAASAVAQSIAMKLLAQREDDDDKLLARYARFVRGGFWRFEPTPVTDIDVAVTCHADDSEQATQLIAAFEARGLRCHARIADRENGATETSPSPAGKARALVALVSESTRDNPWLAYDTGAAWAADIPVVPVLIGAWTMEPPDILAPYQRLNWEAQHERLVNDLVGMLDLTPSVLGTPSTRDRPEKQVEAATARKPPRRPARGKKRGHRKDPTAKPRRRQ